MFQLNAPLSEVSFPRTVYQKSFRLVGGTDEAASALAKLIRQRYGATMAANVVIDPAIEATAVRARITIQWVAGIERPDPRACHAFTGTPGAVA